MPEQNWDPIRRVFYGGSGTAAPMSGDRAGQSFPTNAEMSQEALIAQFNSTYPGASGIAGARVRMTPEYKAALAAFLKSKAAPAPAPSPSPSPLPSPSPSPAALPSPSPSPAVIGDLMSMLLPYYG